MSAQVLIHAGHTAKDVSEAVARAWPDLLFLLYRESREDVEECFLAPHDRMREGSTTSISLDGSMTGREASEAFRLAFGVVVEFSVESGRSVMNVALDKAR